METQKEKILHVILVGQPELNQTLEAADMEQLLQRVSLRYHVRALLENEIDEYIEHRLKIAGIEKNIFNRDMCAEIYKYTGGIPRFINTLCDTVLTCAFADSKQEVDIDDFNNSIQELQWVTYDEAQEKLASNYVSHTDNLYHNDDMTNKDFNMGDVKELIQNSYSPIASRALVEISKQLKRIADHLDKGN